MSVVYTEEEIVKSKIPTIEGFKDVEKEIRSALSGLYEFLPEVFSAATIFGGYAKGNFNLCSDIDVLVLVNDTSVDKKDIFEIVNNNSSLWIALQSAKYRFVKLTVYPIFLSDLCSGQSKADKQFLGHVAHSAHSPGFICGDVRNFSIFHASAPDNTLQRTRGYIERKIEKLQKNLFCFKGLNQEEVAETYLDTYQSPFHAMRRVFDLAGIEYDDSKGGLIDVFAKFSDLRLLNMANILYTHWQDYVVYIESAHTHRGVDASPFFSKDTERSISVLRFLHKTAGSLSK